MERAGRNSLRRAWGRAWAGAAEGRRRARPAQECAQDTHSPLHTRMRAHAHMGAPRAQRSLVYPSSLRPRLGGVPGCGPRPARLLELPSPGPAVRVIPAGAGQGRPAEVQSAHRAPCAHTCGIPGGGGGAHSPMKDTALVLMMPLGRRWKSYSLPSTTTVWPALLPPWEQRPAQHPRPGPTEGGPAWRRPASLWRL